MKINELDSCRHYKPVERFPARTDPRCTSVEEHDLCVLYCGLEQGSRYSVQLHQPDNETAMDISNSKRRRISNQIFSANNHFGKSILLKNQLKKFN